MIAITIDPSEAVSTLRVMAENMADMSDPLTRMLEGGLTDARMEIESMGSLFGEGWRPMNLPWTPLVARTLYGKERDPLTIMDDTGGLIDSLFRGHPGNIFQVGPKEGEAGTAYVSKRNGFGVAAAMQYGTSRTFLVLQGEGFADEGDGIPARPFLAWRDQRLDEYAGMFARHVFDGIEGFVDPASPGVRV